MLSIGRLLNHPYAFFQVDDDNLLRMEPLGLDRRHNKYWRLAPFKDTTPHDPSAGRVFIEDSRDGALRVINDAKQLDGLIQALDPRGVREMELVAELLRLKEPLSQRMPSSPVTLHPASCRNSHPLPASPPLLQAERYLPPGWQCLMDLGVNEDRRLTGIKIKLMQLQAALPPSALMSDSFDRY